MSASDNNIAFNAVLEIAQANVIYRLFPKLRAKANSVVREKILSSIAMVHDYREWTSRNGKFTTTAKYISKSRSKVQLQKKNGKTISIERENPSEQDQEYLDQIEKSLAR